MYCECAVAELFNFFLSSDKKITKIIMIEISEFHLERKMKIIGKVLYKTIIIDRYFIKKNQGNNINLYFSDIPSPSSSPGGRAS